MADQDSIVFESVPPSTPWMYNAVPIATNIHHVECALAGNCAAAHDMHKAYAELVPLMADKREEKLILAAANRFVAVDTNGIVSTRQARAKAD